MNEGDQIIAVARAFNILEELLRSPKPLGLSAIAQSIGLPKVTTFRLLNSLAECGAVSKHNDQYRLGFIFLRYAERVRSDTSLNSIAEPLLRELRDATKETVNLGVLSEGYVVNSLTLPGDFFIITSRVLPLAPLHCSAMGKIFLAYMDEAQISDYFSVRRAKRTIHTITSAEEFQKEREQILGNAVSHDREEYEYGLYCVGAPILDAGGALLAAISITGPTTRMQAKGLESLAQSICDTARKISRLTHEAGLDTLA